MADVFISYSRKDKEFVHKLHDALVERGRDTWVDWKDIPPTADWLAEIKAAIESADTFIFVLSLDSVASQVCNDEVAHAVKHNKRLIPIVCREVDPKTTQPAIAQLNWVFFRPADDFGNATETLVKALDTDLAWVRAHTRLLTRAIEWDGKKRNNAFVLRGADLRAAEEWLAQAASDKEPKPTPLQSEYILASRKTATRQQRITLGAVTFALIVALVLALVAMFQSNEATMQRNTAVTAEAKAVNNQATAIAERNTALSRELAANATARLPIDPEQSVLLAVEAAKVARTAQAEDALRGSLVESHVRAVMAGHTNSVTSAAFSPDGKFVVTASGDKTARVWDAATGKSIAELRAHTNEVNSAAFSPDGKFVVTASGDGTARVWDAATGKSVAELRGHTGSLWSAAFSPDGKFVVTASIDKTARIFACEVCGSIDDLLALAKARITRQLTCEERQSYLHENIVCPTPTPMPMPTITPTRTPTAVMTPTPARTPTLTR